MSIFAMCHNVQTTKTSTLKRDEYGGQEEERGQEQAG